MGAVVVAVGGDHPLVNAPGCLDLDVLLLCEQGAQPCSLLLREEVVASAQRPARGVERVAGPASVPVELLTDPSAAGVKGLGGEADNMEGVHHRRPGGDLLGGCGLAAREPWGTSRLPGTIGATSTCFRQSSGRPASRSLNTAFERPSMVSRSRAVPVRSRTGVRSMITVTYWSPRRLCRQTCSSTARTRTLSNRAGSVISTRRPSASTASFAVCWGTASASVTHATVSF